MEIFNMSENIDQSQTEFFQCICHSDEHTVRFDIFHNSKERTELELFLHVYLYNYRNFFQRCWVAIKYVFGYHCKYGHWDCWSLREEDAERLKDLVDKYILLSKQIKN